MGLWTGPEVTNSFFRFLIVKCFDSALTTLKRRISSFGGIIAQYVNVKRIACESRFNMTFYFASKYWLSSNLCTSSFEFISVNFGWLLKTSVTNFKWCSIKKLNDDICKNKLFPSIHKQFCPSIEVKWKENV